MLQQLALEAAQQLRRLCLLRRPYQRLVKIGSGHGPKVHCSGGQRCMDRSCDVADICSTQKHCTQRVVSSISLNRVSVVYPLMAAHSQTSKQSGALATDRLSHKGLAYNFPGALVGPALMGRARTDAPGPSWPHLGPRRPGPNERGHNGSPMGSMALALVGWGLLDPLGVMETSICRLVWITIVQDY